MTDYYDFFVPENKFVVPVTVLLSNADQVKLRKFINLHYLGDEDANILLDGTYQAKYPEKETEEFKNASRNTHIGHTVNLAVEFDEKGVPTFEVVKNE